MQKITCALLSIGISIVCADSAANSLIEVNKIPVGDSYLLVHANYTVLSNKESGGSIDFSFIDHDSAAIKRHTPNCSQQLKGMNQSNPFLKSKAKNFHFGERTIGALWLLRTNRKIQESDCALESVFEIQTDYYETEFTEWGKALPYTGAFKADVASVSKNNYFFSLKPSIEPPPKTLNFTETSEGNGFIGLTYYHYQFQKKGVLPQLPSIARFQCEQENDGKSIVFDWPISPVSRAKEKYFGTTVQVIPIIAEPNDERFRGLSKCDVSFDIEKHAQVMNTPETYTVRYTLDFNDEQLGH